MQTIPKVGDILRVSKNSPNHYFQCGQLVEVLRITSADGVFEAADIHEPRYTWFMVPDEVEYPSTPKSTALDEQEGGEHYKTSIQPVVYIHANNLNFCEGNIIKYITRWRSKGGKQDLLKIKHYVDLLIELEELNK